MYGMLCKQYVGGGQNKGQARGLMSQGSRFRGALVRSKICVYAKKNEAALEGSPSDITSTQLVHACAKLVAQHEDASICPSGLGACMQAPV